MSIALICIKALEAMFFIGMSGAAVVVVISFIDDAKELGRDD